MGGTVQERERQIAWTMITGMMETLSLQIALERAHEHPDSAIIVSAYLDNVEAYHTRGQA